MASSTELAARLRTLGSRGLVALVWLGATAGCDGCEEPATTAAGGASSSTAAPGGLASSSSTAPASSASAATGPLLLPTCLPAQPLPTDLERAKSAISEAKREFTDGKRAAAATHYERACRGGLLEACHAAARLLSRREQGAELNLPRAIGLLNFACDHGDALGCESLASRYLTGGGVPRDSFRAAFKLKCACKLGSAEACSNFATILRAGVGEDVDKGRAIDVTACEGQVAESCARLATDYEQGTRVEKDAAKAAPLWTRAYQLRKAACEAGRFGFECAELSWMIREGKAVEKPEDAHRYAEKACALLEHGQGCLDSARDFTTGTGVPKDSDAAKERYAKACASGDVDAAGHKEACDASKAK